MGLRSETKFFKTSGFIEAIEAFGHQNVQVVIEHVNRFELAWRNSRDDGDLPSRYHFEHYKNVHGPYRLCHIRVGPNNGYRAAVLFPNGRLEGHWIYAYKKEGRREPQEMERTRNHAKRYWDTRKGDGNG